MKKLLIATLFAVFTLSANVYSVKKLLYNVRKNRETNKFKLTASSIALDYNKEHLEYYEMAKRLMSKKN